MFIGDRVHLLREERNVPYVNRKKYQQLIKDRNIPSADRGNESVNRRQSPSFERGEKCTICRNPLPTPHSLKSTIS